MNISIEHLWSTMGWFARGIIALLLVMSAVAMQVTIRKLIQFGAAARSTRRFSPRFSAALGDGDFEAAARVVRELPHSHLARTMSSVFPRELHHDEEGRATGESVEAVERLLEINRLDQVGEFRRGIGVLATVGATAPFVGLLGTVMGIVNAFAGMAQSSASGIEAVSAGIAEALVATAFGLLVAIPAVWLYNYFVTRIDEMTLEMAHASMALLDALQKPGREPDREVPDVESARAQA